MEAQISMSDSFPVTRSILSAEALSEVVVADYALAVPTECLFFQWGLNDTYLLKTSDATYVLRIYRRGWRSLPEIEYELEVLLFLQNAGIGVSAPIRRKDGRFVGTIHAPEGLRYTVLFTYAPGRQPTYETNDDNAAYQYGKVAAQIHTATKTFQSPHQRVVLDWEHLVDVPLRSIQPMLAHRPEDCNYLQTLTETLRRQVMQLPLSSLEQGFCHGDLHWGNAHVQDGTHTITLFDFDCCGVGWRAYDIAVFRWATRSRKKEQEQWPAFLQGYRDERDIHEREIHAIPYFVALRHVWLLGLHAECRQDLGMGWMNDAYFDEAITFLREWEAEHLDEPT
jgi:Ser/Thr protein kinase RdoA (MazF antagonist)